MAKVKVKSRKQKSHEAENKEAQTQNVDTSTESLSEGEHSGDAGNVANDGDLKPEHGQTSAKESEIGDISDLLNQFADEPIEPEILEPEEFVAEKGKRKRRSKKEMEAETTDKVPLVIPPELVTRVLDSAGNALIGLADSYFAPNPLPQKFIDKMLLDDEQVKQLNPGAKAMIDYLKLNDHPVAAYLGSLFGMQIANYVTIRKIFAEELRKSRENQ